MNIKQLLKLSPYKKLFANKIIVIKCGGSALFYKKIRRKVLEDIVLLKKVGIYPVVVHGGARQISSALAKEKINPKFKQGLRVTDSQIVSIIEKVLEKINKEISYSIVKNFKSKAKGFSGKDLILVKKLEKLNGKKVDLGYVGEIISVDTDKILENIKDYIPIISCLGKNTRGFVYNINADTLAGFLASKLKAEKIIIITNVKGILKEKEKENSCVSSISEKEIQRFIKQKIISDGMLPKVKACIEALRKGVKKAHIISGKIPHALILELLTDEGIGTEITL